eukprot:4235338-Prymnesium_polylepis.1
MRRGRSMRFARGRRGKMAERLGKDGQQLLSCGVWMPGAGDGQRPHGCGRSLAGGADARSQPPRLVGSRVVPD